ncbi:hypothetical protein GALMADRAFT_276302 [Galerina marginata CBS 339.88]|uniref:Uncharacterized protein n=1 Tax=Galerina marginata (strain CBS 339.88) TaxID=685588 RepID=A0A067TE97_GALM3|nr:hypothetical protein GALMADRAFT_276302 [Galerina marginata CBS 339.88]
MLPSPAHLTKCIPLLSYSFASSTFALSQQDDGISNGTALWLGGQCLAMYLAQTHTRLKPSISNSSRPPRAIELGSGIGLTALALCSLGWDVLATDIPHVISSVLKKNIKNNLPNLPIGSGIIQISELDWSVPPDKWAWDHEHAIASHSALTPAAEVSILQPPFDLIFSADTVYKTELSASASRFPPILLCIECRDPGLVDDLLKSASENWKFSVERVPHKKILKALEKRVDWEKSEWEGIELWKLKLTVAE